MEDKRLARDIVGKTVVSKAGKKYGLVGDMVFETRTGELIYVVLKQPTTHATSLELEKGSAGQLMIPFSAVNAVGDFVIVSEEDIV